MKKLLFLLLPILFMSCTKVEYEIEVSGVLKAPGLVMITESEPDFLPDYLVFYLITYKTRGALNRLIDLEYVTFLSPLHSFENPEDYQVGTKMKRGYINGKKGIFPIWKLEKEGSFYEE
jgi:hypothetical protein